MSNNLKFGLLVPTMGIFFYLVEVGLSVAELLGVGVIVRVTVGVRVGVNVGGCPIIVK